MLNDPQNLKGRVFDFTHPQAKENETPQYVIGKQIGEAYVRKYGKDDFKRAMKSISELLKFNPTEEIKTLYKSIDQHELGGALEGFYDSLKNQEAIDKESSQNNIFMKFQADWMKVNPRVERATV